MNCECIIHPFQNDPGTSQNQRIMDALLTDAAKIDARSMADLLNYFVQMSRHINYYDLELNVSDWQPFFRKSTPFVLASIIKFPLKETEDNLALYSTSFSRKPSPGGLQLLSFSLFHRFINNINNWHIQLNESSLPIAATLDNIIRTRLQSTLRRFILLSNTAAIHYGIRSINFHKIAANPVWGLSPDSLSAADTNFHSSAPAAHQRITNLHSDLSTLITAFTDAVTILSSAAVSNLEQSFIPLKDELQKKHPPHLALLFAFLNIFRQLQSNLNEYTRKHLDYFYRDILQFRPEGAVPDSANVLFEIQDALKSYLLKKGLKVKAGKDDNKQDILFELGDEIVVSQTKIGDKRTLFVNNQTASGKIYVEGVYMAPVAEMADGVEKDFTDDPKNFPTLGSKYSKYADPETRLLKTYPDARIGFVLASPVFMLQKGSTRTINIEIPCHLENSVCLPYSDFIDANVLYNEIGTAINASYYHISEDIIKEALKKGISAGLAGHLRDTALTEKEDPLCYCPVNRRKLEAVLTESEFTSLKTPMTPEEKIIIEELIKPIHAFSFLFSGEEGWVEPSSIDSIVLDNTGLATGDFNLKIRLILNPDKGSVTNFNSEVLAEDLGTKSPLLKVELNNKIKLKDIFFGSSAEHNETDGECCDQNPGCCLLKPQESGEVSLYHFFRNVIVRKVNTPVINVEVCGLKNFIVQNDESIMDVNAPVYPFGSRPTIIDFDVVNPRPSAGNKNLSGPNFYIGSKEIFFKKWEDICINLNWKDKPENFNEYYKGYIVRNNYHDCTDPNDNTKDIPGLNECDFEVNLALLENGTWIKENGTSADILPAPNPSTHDLNRQLFNREACDTVCSHLDLFDYSFHVKSSDFDGIRKFVDPGTELIKYKVDSRSGFIRFNLQNQDFLSKDYAYVLARQMMAFGRFPQLVDGAVYETGGVPAIFDISIFFGNIGPVILQIANDTVNGAINGVLNDLIQIIKNKIDSSVNIPLLNGIIARCISMLDTTATLASITIPVLFGGFDVSTLTAAKQNQVKTLIKNFISDLFVLLNTNLSGIEDDLKVAIRTKVNSILNGVNVNNIFKVLLGEKKVVIPNEPWTPVISNISLDYTAKATLQDVDLIHLYPYQGTYKPEEISIQPTLLPAHCDEGTLFLGLTNLVPGNNLNILFQMAEATSDSESDKENIFWHYLESNVWKPLRPGFEIIDDATNNLTGSGIIKLALPANMTDKNTVMPAGLHWIKATIPKNSGAVSETIGIHPHAINVAFTNDEANNKLRLSKPLPAGSISKLEIADASVKSVAQPYESWGGLVPEIEQQFYVRVSETLRHKGRAIQSFDYERIVLQRFPQLFKVKCINHSLGLNAHEYKNDFPYAGGYVIMVVIPDLNRLKAGNSFEPKAPVSLLENINDFIRQKTSPFVRFRAMNPRYEKIDICLKIKLQKNKDENYYKEQVREDIRTFLAPWAVGDYYKLTFGQCVYRSDIIQFLETRDYIDFIGDLRMAGRGEDPDGLLPKVCPDTPRSILIAGDIEVCIIPAECEDWGEYSDCYGKPVQPCDTKPHNISDYCKKRTIIHR